jgi:hypothetical protein
MKTPLTYRPYVPRVVKPQPLIVSGDWRLKFYGIEEEPALGFSKEMRAAVTDLIAAHLPQMEASAHHNTGFVLLHRDHEDVWLLINWWTFSSIISELLFHAELGNETAFEPVTARSVACIWEMVPMMYERDAWVRTVLPLDGSIEAYLSQYLPEGRY